MMIERKTYSPGIYDLSNDEYHGSAGISRSGIMAFRNTPKHFWYKYLNTAYKKEEPTPQMAFGSAVHSYIMEPEKFFDEFYIKTKRDKLPKIPLLKDVGREVYDAAKKVYEEQRLLQDKYEEEFLMLSNGKTVIDEEEFARIQQMKQSLFLDEDAQKLIENAKYEKSIYWVDSDTGLLCKARPDIWRENCIVDLKTTFNASQRHFQSDFYKYGYHIQMAMINEGIRCNTGQAINNFIDIAVEKEEPYAHALYMIDESALQHGLDEFKHYLFKIKECLDSNYWPGYLPQILTLPNYATIGEQA